MASADDGRGQDTHLDDVSIDAWEKAFNEALDSALGFTRCKSSPNDPTLTYEKLLAAAKELKKLPPVATCFRMCDKMRERIEYQAVKIMHVLYTHPVGIQLKVDESIPDWIIWTEYSDGTSKPTFIKPEP